MSDELRRFIFEGSNVRGEHLRLESSYRDILNHHHYPPAVANLLGEFLLAAALLSVTIKFRGTLILQVRGDGEVPLIMAEANSDLQIRGIARGAGQAMAEDFTTLLGNGQLAITIDPHKGQRYQGIVSLNGDNLAQCIENYFAQSEQLATRLWLHADGTCATGMLLQELPEQASYRDAWQHISTLTDTVRRDELLGLPAEELLYRLYHQETVRMFDPAAVTFHCSCSPQRMEAALISLGREELEHILSEQGQIESHCEYCHREYRYSAEQIYELLDGGDSATLH